MTLPGDSVNHVIWAIRTLSSFSQITEVCSRHPGDISGVDADLNTGLHYACQRGMYPVVMKLLVMKADVNAANFNKSSPLFYAMHAAVVEGAMVETQIRIIDLLVKMKADVNARVSGGFTAFYVACQGQNIAIARSLLAVKADIELGPLDEHENCSPLEDACSARNTDVVEFLLNSGAEIKSSCLYATLFPGNASVLRLLLNHNVSLNGFTDSGSPLYYAILGGMGVAGHGEVMQLLLEAGVDPLTTDAHKRAKRSAVRLQSFVRGRQCRSSERAKRAKRAKRSAVRLQSYVRGRQSRSSERAKRAKRSAVRLQSFVRGSQSRAETTKTSTVARRWYRATLVTRKALAASGRVAVLATESAARRIALLEADVRRMRQRELQSKADLDEAQRANVWAHVQISKLKTKKEENSSPKKEKGASPSLPKKKKEPTQAVHCKEDECVVCWEGSKTHAFVPCGHRCACSACAAGVAACPVCRATVTGLLRVFLT